MIHAIKQHIPKLYTWLGDTLRSKFCLMEGAHWSTNALGPDSVIRGILPSGITVSSVHCNGVLQLFGWWASRHLLGVNKRKEARTVIAELNSAPEGDALVDDTIEELDFGIRAENEGGKVTWLECFSTRNMLWKRTLNGMMLQFIQQLNGQNFYCKLENFSRVHFRDQLYRGILSSRVPVPSKALSLSIGVLNSFRLSPYVIQTILGAVSVVGTIPALVRLHVLHDN